MSFVMKRKNERERQESAKSQIRDSIEDSSCWKSCKGVLNLYLDIFFQTLCHK